eukprot:768601-Hanusia_phi.AAC.6
MVHDEVVEICYPVEGDRCSLKGDMYGPFRFKYSSVSTIWDSGQHYGDVFKMLDLVAGNH